MPNNKYNSSIDTFGKWLENISPDSDVIMSSRIRLARNLYKVSFPNWAKKEELQNVITRVFDAANKSGLTDSFFIKLSELSQNEREILVERHLISRDILKSPDTSAAIIDSSEKISIMLNEEDHIRIQVFSEGLPLDDLYKTICRIDDELEENLDYAFSSKWGYDTACITNVGTGMRVSCLLHLPALVLSKKMSKLVNSISQIGLTVRGLFGEGSDTIGAFFQISNQVTLGLSEEEILEKVQNIAQQVTNYERAERKYIRKSNASDLEDIIMRSYGILRYAGKISTNEAYARLSDIKLGIDLGIIKDLSLQKVRRLLIFIQKAHLQKITNLTLSDTNLRSEKRADLIKKIILLQE